MPGHGVAPVTVAARRGTTQGDIAPSYGFQAAGPYAECVQTTGVRGASRDGPLVLCAFAAAAFVKDAAARRSAPWRVFRLAV